MVFLRPRWASVSVPDALARDDSVLFAVLLGARPTTAPRPTPRGRQTSGRRRLRSRHFGGAAHTPGPEYLFATPCRIGHKSDNWAHVWPCGRVPRGVPGAVVGFVGSRQSPLVQLVVTHTEPEPLRSPGITRLRHYYGLLRLLPRPAFCRQVSRKIPRDRSPALRCVASVRAAPNTPAGVSMRFGSLT